jgi:hypothetical protein
MEVPYAPRYAYAEKLAIFEEQSSITSSILPSMERMTGYLTDRTMSKAKAIPDQFRRSVLLEFEKYPAEEAPAVEPAAVPVPNQPWQLPKGALEPTLLLAWKEYRAWAFTAAYYKARLDSLRRTGLVLAIAAACLAFAGTRVGLLLTSLWSRGIVVIAAAAMALAAFFSREALSGSREMLWIRARSAAERLKSLVYLYRSAVAPFDGPKRATLLAQQAASIIKDLNLREVEKRSPSDQPAPTLDSLDVRQYISVRVDDQVNYYQMRARLDQSRLSFWRNTQSVILAFAVLLTAGSVVIREFSELIPVLGTIAVAIVAFMSQGGKQRLIELYWSASQQLTLVRAEWLASGKTDQDKDDSGRFHCPLRNDSVVGKWRVDAAVPRARQYQQ